MKYIIKKTHEGLDIKAFLRLQGVSHSLLKDLKKREDGILVNGIHQNVLYKLKENDILELNIYDTEKEGIDYGLQKRVFLYRGTCK